MYYIKFDGNKIKVTPPHTQGQPIYSSCQCKLVLLLINNYQRTTPPCWSIIEKCKSDSAGIGVKLSQPV